MHISYVPYIIVEKKQAPLAFCSTRRSSTRLFGLWSMHGLLLSGLTFRERELLQKARGELQQQLEVLEQEAWRLRRLNMELQLQGDSAQGEKLEQQEELHLAVRERERL